MSGVINNIIAITLLAVLSFAAIMFAQSQAAYAQSTCPNNANRARCEACQGAGGTFSGGSCTSTTDPNLFSTAENPNSVFNNVINVLTFIVGAISVLMLIIGGIRYVVSAGDQNAVAGAKNTILYAIVGIVIAFAARAIVLFVVDRI